MSHSTKLQPGPFDAAPTEDSAHRVSEPQAACEAGGIKYVFATGSKDFLKPEVDDRRYFVLPASESPAAAAQPAPPQDFPPLSLLVNETRAIPALLLRSIADSHRSAFDCLGFTIHMSEGLETIAGDFVQRATGHLYLVTVTPVVDQDSQAERLNAEAPLYQELTEVLTHAERFIAGFKDSELQEGVAELLARMRRLLPGGALDPFYISTEGMPA